MIQEGLKLTLLGMGVVFAFLGLQMVVINLLARVLKPLTDKEEASRQFLPSKRRGPRRQQEAEDRGRLLAVNSAAIAAHRAQEGAFPGQPALARPSSRPPASGSPSPSPVSSTRRAPSLAQLFFRQRSAHQVLFQNKR